MRSIFDVFKNKNKNLLKNVDKNEITKLCKWFNISKRHLSSFMINLIEIHPEIISLLCNNSVSIELFNKINSNNYNVIDIDYSNIELFKVLPFNENVQPIIDIINNQININDKYYCIGYNDINSISNNKQLLERKIESFFYQIDIIFDINEVNKIDLFNKGNINLYNKYSNKDILLYNKEYYLNDCILKSDTIITMKYNYFIKMYNDSNFINRIKKFNIVFEDNYECINKLNENLKNTSNDISKEEKIIIKTNHILYVLHNSSLSLEEKEYIDYLIKKEYSDESQTFYSKEHHIQALATRLSKIIKLTEIVEFTKNFNNESEEVRKKVIDKPRYNIYVFLKENNLIDLTDISLDDLTLLLGKLNEEQLNSILDYNEIISKYTTRTKLNISFDNLISEKEKKEIIKNKINSNFVKNINRDDKCFDDSLINNTIINGILYLIEYSEFSDDLKKLYTYKVQKLYIDMESDNYYKKYEAMNLLNRLIDDLMNEIGEEISNGIILKYNLEKENKLKKIEKPNFTVNIFINELDNFDKLPLKLLTRKLSELTLVELKIVLSSELVINKYNSLFNEKMSYEEKKKIIIREIKIGNYDFNEDTINFIRNNEINLEEFLRMEEAVLYSEEKINPIIRKYKIQSEDIDSNISISKILGHDNLGKKGCQNILFTISQFFDSKGDGYHTRSIGMLNYTSEDILKELSQTFSYEPICVAESDNDKYTISYNGRHRFTVLKLNYLIELLKGNISKEELEKKYTFNVSITKTNFFRTYCNYILTNIDENIKYISNNYSNEYYKKAESVKIIMKDGKELILSDEELYQKVLDKINEISLYFLQEIEYYYKKLPSFKEFIDKYFQKIKLKFIDKGEINVRGK